MNKLDKFQDFLKTNIAIVETLAYTFCFVIITMSMFRSMMIYVKDFNDLEKAYLATRLDLSETIATSLTFILGAQMFKLFYVSSIKQLVIVISLVIVKMLVSYYLEKEIRDSEKKV
jgi:uncharacterized membrane protein